MKVASSGFDDGIGIKKKMDNRSTHSQKFGWSFVENYSQEFHSICILPWPVNVCTT